LVEQIKHITTKGGDEMGKQHNYGLTEQDEFKATLGWRQQPYKKVILTNVWLAKGRITVDKVEKRLVDGFLYPEWRRKLAFWLVKAIAEADEKKEKTADITQMFSCSFMGNDTYGVPIGLRQENIQNEIMYRLFWRDYETEDVLAVKLNWRVIFL